MGPRGSYWDEKGIKGTLCSVAWLQDGWIFTNWRWHLAKDHLTRKILKVGIHRDWQSKIFCKEFLSGNLQRPPLCLKLTTHFAHVHAHSSAATVLQVSTLFNFDNALPCLWSLRRLDLD